MNNPEKLIDLGEFATQGVGGWDESWYSLMLDPQTGEHYVKHSWSNLSRGFTDNSGESFTLLHTLKPDDWIFQRATTYLQSLEKE